MESTNQPTILIFTDWYLPGFKAGGPISSVSNLVSALGGDFRFRLVCQDRDYLDEKPYPKIKPDTWVKQGDAEVFYLSPQNYSYRYIKKLITVERPDAVYINGMFSKIFSIYSVLASTRLGKKTIVAPRGMLAPGALGIKSGKKQTFLNLTRVMGVYRNVIFHSTHAHESLHIKEVISEKSKLVELANIPKMICKAETGQSKRRGYLRLVTVARVAREKNINFALKCLEHIPTHLQIEFDLVGPVYDSDYMEQCRASEKKLPANVKLHWHGALTPSETGKMIEKADLFFLPTLGENYGHAILESMMCGVPVLISDQTPWRDLQAESMGADLALVDQKAFETYLVNVAEMNQDEYKINFAQVSANALKRVDMPALMTGYKTLFG